MDTNFIPRRLPILEDFVNEATVTSKIHEELKFRTLTKQEREALTGASPDALVCDTDNFVLVFEPTDEKLSVITNDLHEYYITDVTDISVAIKLSSIISKHKDIKKLHKDLSKKGYGTVRSWFD